MNYFDQLKQAARIFRQTKALWLLGIIAALFGQNEYGFSVNYSERTPASSTAQPDAPFADILANPWVASFLANPFPYLLGIGALMLIGWMITSLVGWFVQGAMIDLAARANQDSSPSLRTSLRASRQHIWPLFLIYLVLSIPTIVVIILAALLIVPLFLSIFRTSTPDFSVVFPRLFGTLACLIPLFLLNGLAGIVLRLLNVLAARACVLEHLAVRESLRRGWFVLRRNVGYTVLNWFLFLIFGAIFGFVAALPALLLLITAGQAFLHNDWTPWALSAAIGVGIYFVVMSIGVGGSLTGFNSTVWTVLYQAFQRKADAPSDDAAPVPMMNPIN
jgi:hypothetical protein